MHLPDQHSAVLDRIRTAVSGDERFVGLAAGGSLVTGGMDEHSDLDLVVVVSDEHQGAVMQRRHEIARGWGDLLAAFTGEHVGEPRLLVCLYADPLMHVDLKFVTVDELVPRIEDPVVIWERGSAVSRQLAATGPTPLAIDPQWMEDRFWTWVHYAATKLARGELFEVLDFLAFLRGRVIAPLAMHVRGLPPRGARRLEEHAPELVEPLARTAVSHDARECADAVTRCVDLYRSLRDQLPDPLRRNAAAEGAALAHLRDSTGGGASR